MRVSVVCTIRDSTDATLLIPAGLRLPLLHEVCPGVEAFAILPNASCRLDGKVQTQKRCHTTLRHSTWLRQPCALCGNSQRSACIQGQEQGGAIPHAGNTLDCWLFPHSLLLLSHDLLEVALWRTCFAGKRARCWPLSEGWTLSSYDFRCARRSIFRTV